MSSSTPLRVAAASTLLFIAGCNSVHTELAPKLPFVPKADLAGGGIPYHLPAGLVTLKLSFAETGPATDKRLAPTVELAATHYPDPKRTFLLVPSHNPLFSTHHTISVSNGLLASVSTIEEGKIKDAVLSIAQTGINLVKLKTGLPSFSAQSDADTTASDIFLNGSPHPTEEEIAYVIGTTLGSTMALTLIPNHDDPTAQSEQTLGTAKLLKVVTSLSPIPASPKTQQPTSQQPAKPQQPTINFSEQTAGVYTRALKPYLATVDLVLCVDALRTLRLLSHDRAKRALLAEQNQESFDAKTHAEKIKRLREEYAPAAEHLRSLQKEVAAFDLALARHDLPEELRKTRAAAREDAVKVVTALKTATEASITTIALAEKAEAQFRSERQKRKEKLELIKNRINAYNDASKKTALPTGEVPLRGDVTLRTNIAVVALPDPESIVRVPITRMAFGTTTNTVEFKDGLLVKYDSKQPGAVAEFFTVPVEFTKTIIDAVAGIFQFRIDTSALRKTAATSDVELAKALKTMREELDKLRAAPALPAPTPTAPTEPSPTSLTTPSAR
jgi:hypothetical protein